MHYGDNVNRDYSTRFAVGDKWTVGHNATFTDEVEIVRNGYESSSDELPIEVLKAVVAAHCRHRVDGSVPEPGETQTVGDLVAELLRLDPSMPLLQAMADGALPKSVSVDVSEPATRP